MDLNLLNKHQVKKVSLTIIDIFVVKENIKEQEEFVFINRLGIPVTISVQGYEDMKTKKSSLKN
jgi:hypothetical protein